MRGSRRRNKNNCTRELTLEGSGVANGSLSLPGQEMTRQRLCQDIETDLSSRVPNVNAFRNVSALFGKTTEQTTCYQILQK
jgi:hypothetical protein